MVTIRDIAKLSGYSVTTVSRALNDHDDVNPDTKAIIRTIANREGYAPNILAQGLVSKDAKTFGFITSTSSGPSPMDNFTYLLFMKSIERANTLGYDIVMIHYNNAVHKNKSFQQLIAERNLSGAILQGFDKNDALCQQAYESDVPTVFIDIGLSNKSSGYVVSNIAKAAEIGFDYLLNQCGYEDLLFVHGSLESWVTTQWQTAVTNAAAKYQPKLNSFAKLNGQYKLHVAQTVIKENRQLLRKGKMAIFCASDLMGVGVMRALQELGYIVPRDFGILGYDGIDVAEYVTPPLSTIAQHPAEIGAQTVDLLLDLKNKNQVTYAHSYKDIDVELIVRASTREVGSHA